MIKVEQVFCALCDWRHDEPVAESAMPPGMMNAFSDPVRLQEILIEQREQRMEAALKAHLRDQHPWIFG